MTGLRLLKQNVILGRETLVTESERKDSQRDEKGLQKQSRRDETIITKIPNFQSKPDGVI